MPELPEVQTVVLGLENLLLGHKILEVQTDWPKSLRITPVQLKDYVLKTEIMSIRRIGKMIFIDLSSNYSLIIHLKLTGQLVFHQRLDTGKMNIFGAGHPSDSLVSQLPDKTTHVIFTLEEASFLFFNDMRKFGWIKLLCTTDINQSDLIQRLGPDALSVQSSEFTKLLMRRHKAIKACLLDQNIIAGCGNIYADESLWLSKIHPQKPASELTLTQLSILHHHLQDVLNFSISKGGSSSRNYVNALGQKGRYLDFVNVYQKAGIPCSRCQFPIKRIKVASRGTYICQRCQQ